MKKQVLMVAVSAMVALTFTASSALADMFVPGASVPRDQSVMGVGKTIVEIGAKDRALTEALNQASKNVMQVNPNTGVDVYQQFGSSQTDQSWKAAKSVEEAHWEKGIPSILRARRMRLLITRSSVGSPARSQPHSVRYFLGS